MPRVTTSEVKCLRNTDVDVTHMIVAANLIVTDLSTGCGSGFSDELLASIELWLSAHFVGTIDPTLSIEKFENAENTYMVGSDSLNGIMSDKYGQTANMLSGGCLAQLDQQPATVDFL